MYTWYVIAGVALCVIVYLFLFRGLLMFTILGGIAYTIIQFKRTDDKKKGVHRFGHLVDRLTLTPESITIGNNQFPAHELERFSITADDYFGKGSGAIDTSVGVDNFLEFTHQKVDYSFQFQVKRRSDLAVLFELEKAIKGRIEGGRG